MEQHIRDGGLSKDKFGDNFKWGVSTAAYQIEGGHDINEKGHSIWDVFSATKGKILQGHHGNIACDFYNRYQDDIALIKQLNIPNFRFSISWTRIIPAGTGKVSQAGIDYYNRIINHCLELGIAPWLTLYHWDLPYELELKGGWTNRNVVSWFCEFVEVCVRNFGDRVKYWMVMNEPAVFTGAGYFFGVHAPGRTGLKNFIPAIHHAVLSMSEGARLIRSVLPAAEIGTTFSCSHIDPFSTKKNDLIAATRVDALLNRTFIEPVLGLGYPVDDLPVIKKIEKYILPGDEQLMPFDFDFIGLQNYTREIVKYSFLTPYLKAKLIKAEKRNVPLTTMKWEVYPASIYYILKKFDKYPQIKKIIITENGAAFPDVITNSEVNDPLRVKYLQDYIAMMLKARQEGCKVDGYFVWTLTDNFEWAEGYNPRFGLIHVDFDTQKRTIKTSGKWYAEFLK